jgi:hypothetical protein
MDKVRVIEGSLRCFSRSLFGLIPVLGLPFAVSSVFNARKLRRASQYQWNPAGRYLTWGTVLGCLGILISVVALAAVGNFLFQLYTGVDSS